MWELLFKFYKSTVQFLTATSFTQFIIKDINLQLANGNPNVYIYEQTYGSKIMQPELSDQVTQKLNGYRRELPRKEKLKHLVEHSNG